MGTGYGLQFIIKYNLTMLADVKKATTPAAGVRVAFSLHLADFTGSHCVY